jgi:hypothetical protein
MMMRRVHAYAGSGELPAVTASATSATCQGSSLELAANRMIMLVQC